MAEQPIEAAIEARMGKAMRISTPIEESCQG